MPPIIGRILKKFVDRSNRVTLAYEKKFSFFCDLYMPRFGANPNEDGNYDQTNIFTTHQPATYPSTPDVLNAKFYFVGLFKKESMNSSELEWDSFYLDDDSDRPFIETSKSRELPIQTKVKIYIEQSTLTMMVERKQVVQGASGHMLIRQYLIPCVEG